MHYVIFEYKIDANWSSDTSDKCALSITVMNGLNIDRVIITAAQI